MQGCSPESREHSRSQPAGLPVPGWDGEMGQAGKEVARRSSLLDLHQCSINAWPWRQGSHCPRFPGEDFQAGGGQQGVSLTQGLTLEPAGSSWLSTSITWGAGETEMCCPALAY